MAEEQEDDWEVIENVSVDFVPTLAALVMSPMTLTKPAALALRCGEITALSLSTLFVALACQACSQASLDGILSRRAILRTYLVG